MRIKLNKELQFLIFKMDVDILKKYYDKPYEYLKDFLKTFLESDIYNYEIWQDGSIEGTFELRIPNKEFDETIYGNEVYSIVLLLSFMYDIPLNMINDFNSDYVLNIYYIESMR